MVDAKTTSRWYFVIAMGRKAGSPGARDRQGGGRHADADLGGVPVADPAQDDRRHAGGAIIKRLSDGRRDGVAIIAEGVVLDVAEADLAGLHDVERDSHGHLRIAEVNLGEILKAQVQARLRELGIKTTIAAKNIGYELRCADPIPLDMEYTRDLGYCAAKYLLAGGNAAMISMQGGHFVPVPFAEMIDAADRPDPGPAGRCRVDALRHRAALHDPAAPRRLRGSAQARQARRAPCICRSTSSAASSNRWLTTSRPGSRSMREGKQRRTERLRLSLNWPKLPKLP